MVAATEAGEREPPRREAVASREEALAAVATKVTLHGTSPWHLSNPFRNGVTRRPP